MAEPAHQCCAATRAQVAALLKGMIFGPNGRPMSPSHTRRRGRIYRYYVTREAIADGYESCAVTSVPATDVEGTVLDYVPETAGCTGAGRTHLGSCQARGRRHHRARGHRPARRLRHGLARAVSGRAGTHRPVAGRAGRPPGGCTRGADQGRGTSELGRGTAAGSRENGGMIQRAEIKLDGSTLVVRIPMRFPAARRA
jgi:hypothetical protein